MKKFLLVFIFLVSCSNPRPVNEYERYTFDFFYTFNTITTVTAFAKTHEDFNELKTFIQTRMTELHRLYSIFDEYEGINNIKTINGNAGISPVEVSRDIIDLLEFSVLWHERTGGAFNIALGPVLRVWHEYRERYQNETVTSLPDISLLNQLNELTVINDLIIDKENSTVFLSKQGMSLDVGSVAKGFAVQRIIDEVLQSDLAVKDFIIDAGGNVGIAGTHRVRETGVWRVDVLNPLNQNAPLASFDVFGGMSVVTSGNYMRYYTHNGLVMGHIISPSTLMPADHFTAVTVVSRNSAVADVLSTAIFILPYQAGLDLAERYAIDAVWLMQDGTVRTYPLF